MKQKLFFFLACTLLALKVPATTLMVSVENDVFAPASVTIHLGDTVMFMWVVGTHTTTSTTIPSGAVSWDNPMDAAHTMFTYVPAVTGTYNYQCTFHVAMGMVGSFTVIPPTGVQQVTTGQFLLYPNPVSGTVHMSFTDTHSPVNIQVSDVTGKEIMKTSFNSANTISLDLSAFGTGMYFIKAEQNEKTYVDRVNVIK
jgi:plastocyanin